MGRSGGDKTLTFSDTPVTDGDMIRAQEVQRFGEQSATSLPNTAEPQGPGKGLVSEWTRYIHSVDIDGVMTPVISIPESAKATAAAGLIATWDDLFHRSSISQGIKDGISLREDSDAAPTSVQPFAGMIDEYSFDDRLGKPLIGLWDFMDYNSDRWDSPDLKSEVARRAAIVRELMNR
jgi:hypothetical protein